MISKNYLQIISVLCSLSSLITDGVFPDWYHLNITNKDYQHLAGYYKREDATQDNEIIYKKPRLPDYLSVEDHDGDNDGLWTVEGSNYKIKMYPKGNHVPESGKWQGRRPGEKDDEDVDILITEYKLDYPEYFVINSSNHHIKGFYKKDNKIFLEFPVFKKNKEPNYSLFLHLEGEWRIDREASEVAGIGLAQSLDKGLPDPGLAKGWSVWNGGWDNGTTFQVFPLNPSYPKIFNVEFVGNDKEILKKLQEEQVLGNYTKQPNIYEGVPVYMKPEGQMNLFRCWTGQWVIAYDVSRTTSSNNAILYQESNGSPTPIDDIMWRFDHNPIYLRLTSTQEGKDSFEDDANLGLIIGVVISIVVLTAVLITITIVTFFIKKMMNKEKEEPKVDDNMYYGDDDYYDKEEYTAVVDNNDYYQH